MKSFEDLYYELLKATIENKDEEYISSLDSFDTNQLDCLLHPKSTLLYGLQKAAIALMMIGTA